VFSIYRLARIVGLPDNTALGLALVFCFSTVALCYARLLNAHMLLLGITAAMVPPMLRWAKAPPTGIPCLPLLQLGTLGGLAYAAEAGAGPIILAGLGVWIAYRCNVLGPQRGLAALALFTLAALPWLAAHHAITYAIAGTIKPPNTVPEYFNWPESPFKPENMTGAWQHAGLWSFVVYLLDLLGGQKGFLGNNLVLYLALPGLPRLAPRPVPERSELACAAVWFIGIILIYSATSNNFSGVCVSVRWFVPLLAPAFLFLAVLLREFPEYRR